MTRSRGTTAGLAIGLSLLLAGGILSVPVWGQAQAPQVRPPQSPPAGMLNYVEGQASINGQAVGPQSVGSARLQAGQTLATQNGRVEMLLTPGVMVRLDNNSSVTMDNPGLPDTDITVQSGRVMIEADQVMPQNHIDVRDGAATVLLVKHGLYDFDASHGVLRVFDGQAKVTVAGKEHMLQNGHEMNLGATKLHAQGFNKKTEEQGSFYRWSSLRAAYLAEANADAARGLAQGYYGNTYSNSAYYGAPYYGYAGYDYPGWYWDPYWDAYTWLPWDGIFFDPFGWGFYSVGFGFAAPFYGGGFRGGYHAFGPGFRPSVAPRAGGSALVSGGLHNFGGNGFAGGAHANGFAGGGFHGGGGGFGGGFHGGGFGGGGRR